MKKKSNDTHTWWDYFCMGCKEDLLPQLLLQLTPYLGGISCIFVVVFLLKFFELFDFNSTLMRVTAYLIWMLCLLLIAIAIAWNKKNSNKAKDVVSEAPAADIPPAPIVVSEAPAADIPPAPIVVSEAPAAEMPLAHRFMCAFTSAQIEKLSDELSNYIPNFDQASYDYVFGGKNRPAHFKPLNWEGQLTELSAFINVFFREEPKRWAKTAHCFTKHGKPIKEKSLSSAIPSNEEHFERIKKSLGL